MTLVPIMTVPIVLKYTSQTSLQGPCTAQLGTQDIALLASSLVHGHLTFTNGSMDFNRRIETWRGATRVPSRWGNWAKAGIHGQCSREAWEDRRPPFHYLQLDLCRVQARQ